MRELEQQKKDKAEKKRQDKERKKKEKADKKANDKKKKEDLLLSINERIAQIQRELNEASGSDSGSSDEDKTPEPKKKKRKSKKRPCPSTDSDVSSSGEDEAVASTSAGKGTLHKIPRKQLDFSNSFNPFGSERVSCVKGWNFPSRSSGIKVDINSEFRAAIFKESVHVLHGSAQ